jgi:hypothetical protein
MVSVTSCSVLSSIGAQTAGPIGLKIGTNTHWNYAMKIGGSAIAMRAQHHISSIDGQTTGPIEPQIGTNTQ